MNKSTITVAVLVMAAGAAAQNTLHNGGFEIPGNLINPIEGWHAINSARLREVGDGLGPILVRSGTRSIELASGSFTFVGFTTNTFNPNTLGSYDPPYVYQGGPATVSGYYAIPADQPLVGANAGFKLEFRRSNSSHYQVFETLSITGHTNGQWVPFSMTITDAQMPVNGGTEPVSVSVLPERFGPGASTGTIFWDDLTFVQVLCYANCDGSTTPPVLNVQDFGCFLNKFAAGDTYANCDNSTTKPVLNVQDFGCFLNKFAAGCS